MLNFKVEPGYSEVGYQYFIFMLPVVIKCFMIVVFTNVIILTFMSPEQIYLNNLTTNILPLYWKQTYLTDCFSR